MTSQESYFYSSPIEVLETQWKDNKLYSISRARSYKNSKQIKFNAVKGRRSVPPLVLSLFSKLDDYFSGKRIKKWNIPLYLRGTSFHKKVWKYLSHISYGKQCTYSHVAKDIGFPKAFRAVGSACGKNPWLILVPCHRVVSQTGLGGFALGLKAKSHLLNIEMSTKWH